jgi:uncharacterized protein (TIGR02147 family)
MKAPPSISHVLISHFEMKQAKNAGYSKRAYSRDLGVSPAFLSQILSNKRSLSPARAELISKKLNLSQDERDYLIAQAITSTSRSETLKAKASTQLKRLIHAQSTITLAKSDFAVISDWHHLAIFQSMFLKNYPERCEEKGEVTYLSQFLKVPAAEVTDALKRLSRLKVIESKGSFHRPLMNHLAIKNKAPSAVIRKFHRQIIEKSLVAMEAQSVERRLFNTTTLTINDADLPSIARDYETFYQGMIQKYSNQTQSDFEPNSVYAFSTQLFALSHETEKT